MTHYLPVGLTWRALRLGGHRGNNGFADEVACARRIELRLARILGEWERTPFASGQCRKQMGASCQGFLAGLLDELYGRRVESKIPILPIDIGLHNRRKAKAGMKWFMRNYPNHERVNDGFVEPGDLVVVGPSDGGPGHCMFVGPRENTLWHSVEGSGVCYTGMSLPSQNKLYAVYRPLDKEVWRHGC